MKKFALFVFNGDPMCFIHVLLNAFDLNRDGSEARIIIEGSATGLVPELVKEGNPLKALWEKAKSKSLVDGVCKACAQKMGTREAAEAQGLALLDDMSGHPGMGGYVARGFEILTF
jgi:hypothetical protein